MRLLESLNGIFDRYSKLKVLRFLVRTEAELSGREIAKAVGISHVNCNHSLQELASHGIINMRKVGPSILYSLNKQHVLVADILFPMFFREKNIFSVLKKILLENLSEPKPVSIVLFGSQREKNAARPDSDIDLFIILPNNIDLRKFKKEISMSEIKIERIFGNCASLLIVRKDEFLNRRKRNDPLITEIEANNKLLFGKPLKEVM